MTRQAKITVNQAITAAGSTDLAAVSLALEDVMEQVILHQDSAKGLPEKSIKAKVFSQIGRLGIKTTGDLQKIISEVEG